MELKDNNKSSTNLSRSLCTRAALHQLTLLVLPFFWKKVRMLDSSINTNAFSANNFSISPSTGKNPTYPQAIIKVFAHNTVHCVKLLAS